MVKQDLFDFKYIEDQVSTIKQSMAKTGQNTKETNITEIMTEQLEILRKINNNLNNIKQNTKSKKSLFQFKK